MCGRTAAGTRGMWGSAQQSSNTCRVADWAARSCITNDPRRSSRNNGANYLAGARKPTSGPFCCPTPQNGFWHSLFPANPNSCSLTRTDQQAIILLCCLSSWRSVYERQKSRNEKDSIRCFGQNFALIFAEKALECRIFVKRYFIFIINLFERNFCGKDRIAHFSNSRLIFHTFVRSTFSNFSQILSLEAQSVVRSAVDQLSDAGRAACPTTLGGVRNDLHTGARHSKYEFFSSRPARCRQSLLDS